MSFVVATQLPIRSVFHYLNSTHKTQIVRLVASDKVVIEKVVFPQQRILLENIDQGRLEVYEGQDGKKTLQKVVHCQDGSVTESKLQLTVI